MRNEFSTREILSESNWKVFSNCICNCNSVNCGQLHLCMRICVRVYVCVQSGFVGWNGEPLVSGWLEGKSVGLARALSHGTCDSPVPTHQRQSVPAGDFISSCLCQPCGISLTKIWRPGSFQTKGHAWRPSEVLFCLISDEWSMVTLLFFFFSVWEERALRKHLL